MFEGAALGGVGVVAVADALVVLGWLVDALRRRRDGRNTWYLVRRVLQTPVSNIIPTRNGIVVREGIVRVQLGMTSVKRRMRVS